MLVLTQSAMAVVNAHPALKAIEGGWQVLVPGLSLAISLLMGLVLPDYNPVQQTVSQMVHYPHGWLLTTDFVVLAVWLIVLADKFYFVFARQKTTKIAGLILFLTAIGFILIAIFPTNPEGTTRNTAAQIHEQAARGISILFPVACLALLPQLCIGGQHRRLAIYTLFTAIAGLVFVVLCATVILGEGATLGLSERLLIANALIWGLVVGHKLFPARD